jgi:hypothetical protein
VGGNGSARERERERKRESECIEREIWKENERDRKGKRE